MDFGLEFVKLISQKVYNTSRKFCFSTFLSLPNLKAKQFSKKYYFNYLHINNNFNTTTSKCHLKSS